MRQRLLEDKQKEKKKEKSRKRKPKEGIIKPKRIRKSKKGLKVRRGGPTFRQLMFIAEMWKIPNSTNVTSKTKLKNMIINFLEE